MDRLREHTRSGMSESVRVEVERLLNAKIREAEQRQQDLIRSVEGLEQQIMERVDERQANFLQREEETEILHAAVELARQAVRVEMLEDEKFKNMERELETEEQKKEKLRQERYALEMENRRMLHRLQMKQEEEYDRRMPGDVERLYAMGTVAFEMNQPIIEATLTGSQETATRKITLLKDFRSTAAKWMESDDHCQETNRAIPAVLKGWIKPKTNRATPAVLKGWMVRERWQHLQDNNKAVFDDRLQTFTCHAEIETMIRENEKFRREHNRQFEKELKQHYAKRDRELKKIRAAEMKERKALEGIIKKEKEKQRKAEEKTKKAQEKQRKAEEKTKKEQEEKEGEKLLQEALAMVQAKKAQAEAEGEGGQEQGKETQPQRRRWRIFSLKRRSS